MAKLLLILGQYLYSLYFLLDFIEHNDAILVNLHLLPENVNKLMVLRDNDV